MQRLLIRNIKTLVSCDEQDTVYENVDLYAENGIFTLIDQLAYFAVTPDSLNDVIQDWL